MCNCFNGVLVYFSYISTSEMEKNYEPIDSTAYNRFVHWWHLCFACSGLLPYLQHFQFYKLFILFGACISLLVEFIAYRPMRKKKAPRLFIMISAYGINMFIINLTLVLLGANLREFPISIGQTAFLVGNISIGKIDIIALIVSLISLLVLWIFLEKTTAGIAIRACSQDSSTAGLMGINGNKVSTMVFAISGVTAAVAGIFFGIKYTVYPNLGDLATKAFIASVIGGLGSLPGAITGGILLGVLETMVSGYISSTYRDLFAYGFMVVMLLFLPNGLMGKTSQDKL